MPISTGSNRSRSSAREHVARRQDGDLVLGGAAAEQDDDTGLLHGVFTSLEIPSCAEQEAPLVDQLGDHLAERLAGAVAGLALDPEQNGGAAGGRRLQPRRHLAGVHRIDAGVRLRGVQEAPPGTSTPSRTWW